MINFKDGFSCFLSCRRIKNAIIGNQTKKSSFMLLGVIPRLVGGGRVGGRGLELQGDEVIYHESIPGLILSNGFSVLHTQAHLRMCRQF